MPRQHGRSLSLALLTLLVCCASAWSQVNVASVSELVNAVNNQPAGTRINLAPGVYQLSAALRPKSGMSLVGAGIGLTILRNCPRFAFPRNSYYGDDVDSNDSFPDRYLIDLGDGQRNITVQGMTLLGPEVYGGIHFIRADKVTLSGLEFREFRWSGIRGFEGTNFTITGNRFTDSGGQVLNPDGTLGTNGGCVYLTYLSKSLIQNNRLIATRTRPDEVYGIKGREFRSVRIVSNTIDCFFSIELAFENDDYVDIENNLLKGAVSIPKYAGGERIPPGPDPYTFRIRNNFFTTNASYSIEGPRNWLIVENNVFNVSVSDDDGRIFSTFDPTSETPRAPGPVTFRNNIVINPGRGVFWSDVCYDNLTFANNHIFANESIRSQYPEGLFSFRGSSPALEGQTTNFASISLINNIVEVLGTPRAFIRFDDTYAANISNNLLVNTTDAAIVPNPPTGSPRGLLNLLAFNVGVNGELAVNGQALLIQAGANPAVGFVGTEDLYRYAARPTDLNGDGRVTPADRSLAEQNVRRSEIQGMVRGRR